MQDSNESSSKPGSFQNGAISNSKKELGSSHSDPSKSSTLSSNSLSSSKSAKSLKQNKEGEETTFITPEPLNTNLLLQNFRPTYSENDVSTLISETDNYVHHRAIINIDEEANTLGRLLAHHLKKKSKLTKTDIANFLFSAVVAGGSLALYWHPTLEFAGEDLRKIILFELSVNLANFGVSAYTASETFNSFVDQLPPELRRAISNQTDQNQKVCGVPFNRAKVVGGLRVAGMGTLALVSAAPYALAANEPVWVRLIVGITNAVINYYGLNNIIYDHYKFLRNRFSTSSQVIAHQKILASFKSTVEKITDDIIQSKVVPEDLRESSPSNEVKLLKSLAEKASRMGIEAERPMTSTQLIARRLIPGTTGALLVSGVGVYLLKTYESFEDTNSGNKFNIPITGVISAPFLYLAVTFGAKTVIDIVDAITCHGKKPLAMQLNPKTTIATMLSLAFIVSFSFATIADFVINDPYFKQGGPFEGEKDFALILAALGAIIFNNYANQKLAFKIIESLARMWGSQKDLANFGIEMKAFLENATTMDPKVLAESFKKLTFDEQVALLPMYKMQDNIKELLDSAIGKEIVEEDNGLMSKFNKLSNQAKTVIKNYYSNEEDHEIKEFEKLPLRAQVNIAKTKYGALPVQNIEEPVPLAPRRGFFAPLTDCWSKLPSLPRVSFWPSRNYEPISEDHINDFIERGEASSNTV